MNTLSREEIEMFTGTFGALKNEMQKRIIGCDEVVEGVLNCFFAGGNVLIESGPGLGKTLIVKTLAEVMDLKFRRIQFTPDLMPSDIIGTTIVMENEEGEKVFEFQQGPVFTQILLADEINRATPKAQSALLEAMQERMVSVGGKTYQLDLPYFVLATQNAADTEGTYALPEAQVDRFLYKLELKFPSSENLQRIGDTTTTNEDITLKHLCDGDKALQLQETVRRVSAPEPIEAFAVNLILRTNPASHKSQERVKRFLRYGSSPRGVQGLILGGKVQALINGKGVVEEQHITAVAKQVLGHRLILNLEGEAEQIKPHELIEEAITDLAAAVA